jgi:large subunit ribosomal protein L11
MAKEIVKMIRLQIEGGKATPAPPIGTALGPAGVNIAQFCKEFNDMTREKAGIIIPVVMTVYNDRSYTFIMKQPPASRLLLKAIGQDKGSGKAPNQKVGKVSQKQLEDMAKQKLEDLNTTNVAQAKKIIAGTARSMGIDVE